MDLALAASLGLVVSFLALELVDVGMVDVDPDIPEFALVDAGMVDVDPVSKFALVDAGIADVEPDVDSVAELGGSLELVDAGIVDVDSVELAGSQRIPSP